MKLVNGLSGVSVERHVNFMGTGFVDEWPIQNVGNPVP